MKKYLSASLLLLISSVVRPALAQDPPPPTATESVAGPATPTVTPLPATATVPATITPLPTVMPTLTATTEPTATATGPVEPTISPTPVLTDTVTPTVTPTATALCADPFEPNEAPAQGTILLNNQPLAELTLAPRGDLDHFQLWVKLGRYYQLETAGRDGVDTRLRLFDPAGQRLAENDDYLTGSPGSRLTFQAPVEGWLVAVVDSLVPIDWGCGRYNISLSEVAGPTPTPTATAEPTRTPRPTAVPPPTETPLPALYDAHEPNPDVATAADIGVNQSLRLNFHVFPPGDPGVDHDFFRLYVKTGQILQIETLALAPGLDTNVILYREDGTTIIAGNDDCAPGEQRSCLTWAPNYTGLAYLLVGPVGLTPTGHSAEALSYQLQVTNLAGQPTPTPSFGQPLPWPADPVAAEQMTPESTVTPTLRVQTFSLAPPTPTPLPLQPITVQLTVYYDENDNQAPDLSEGVTGINLQILDRLTNRVLGQAVTNGEGHATLFVSATQDIRLSVPYLGYSQRVKPPGGAFEIRIPALHLPSLIP